MHKFYKININGIEWEVPEIYEVLQAIDTDDDGQMCKALVKGTSVFVNIKKLNQPLQSAEQAKKTYRQLKLLRHFNHKNIIALLNVFQVHVDNFVQIYFVFEAVETDLKIVSQQKLSEERVKEIVHQILEVLKVLHLAGITHGNLNPSNVAFTKQNELKIKGFGLAPVAVNESMNYVPNRWYCAPEIVFNWMNYYQPADMWSVGCIMAELLTRRKLFPGVDIQHQLELIINILGTPSDDFIEKISSESERNRIKELPYTVGKDFKELFPEINPKAIDLLQKMLLIDADKRITAQQALDHPYLKKESEPSDEQTLPLFVQSFENVVQSMENWKKLILKEIIDFQPPALYAEILEKVKNVA